MVATRPLTALAFGSGYRRAPGAEARLRIRLSYGRGSTLAMWPMALLAPAALAGAWWIHRQSSASWVFVVVALLLLPYALHRFLAVFDWLEITASRSTLRIQRSRFWPRGITELPAASGTTMRPVSPSMKAR